MPDDKGDGGTPSKEGTTFTQEDLDKAIADARAVGMKEGRTEAQGHFQSIADKGISAARADAENLRQKVKDLNNKVLESLPEGERPMAEIRQALAELRAERAPSSTQPKNDDTGGSPAPTPDPQREVREAVESLGIDAEDLDFSKGLKPFFAEVQRRLSAKDAAAKKAASTKETKDSADNSITTSDGAQSQQRDWKNPEALITSGALNRFN